MEDISQESVATHEALVAPRRHPPKSFSLSIFSASPSPLPAPARRPMEEERRIREYDGGCSNANDDGASNAASVSCGPMERGIRDGAAGGAAARNRGESSSRAAAEGTEAVIRWERFLPRRFLRVLLVEYDDSTRHIVAALLRKCSYHVSAVADGLKAWEFLKEKHFNFDLVLTEVAIPSLSGIGLLSKIMSNDVCKSIPVIMMSSHDSIGIVFKCMLKGAADFLVKPVRKNELQNLWQHVWRKHCSSSSGNISVSQIPNQARYEAMSDNNANSNHGSVNAGNKSRRGNSLEKGNDTQSSCSKPEAENESKQERQEPAQIEHPFSREVESKFDEYDNAAPQVVTTPLIQEDEKAKDKLMGLEIKVTLSIQAAASTEKIQDEMGFDDVITCKEDKVSVKSKEDSYLKTTPSNQNHMSTEPSRQAIDFIGTIAIGQCSVHQDGLCETTELSSGKGSMYNNSSSPVWELSLRRPLMNSLDEHAFQQRHVLRQSDASAFSRYGKSRTLSSPKSGSSSASLCIRTKECGVDCQPQAGTEGTAAGTIISFSIKDNNEAAIYDKLPSVSNKEDTSPLDGHDLKGDGCVGYSSTEKLPPHPQLGFFPLQIPVGSIPFQSYCASYGAILQPVYHPGPSSHVHGSAVVQKVKDRLPCDQSSQCVNCLTDSLQYISCKHSNQSYSSHQSKQVIMNHRVDIEGVDAARAALKIAEEADQSASCSRSIYNGSGSNGSNEDTNAALNAGPAVESGNEDGFQSCNGQGSNRDCARREAALIKFRLKRKDRCFEKKVRYHSRKKLAEQRPRLKGQFVRQKVVESTTTGTETDD